MTYYEAWQGTIRDGDGDVVNSPVVTVRNKSDNTLADIFADDAGTPISNPVIGNVNGFVKFWMTRGKYTVVASDGVSDSATWDVEVDESELLFDTVADFLAYDGSAVPVGTYARTRDRVGVYQRVTDGTGHVPLSSPDWDVVPVDGKFDARAFGATGDGATDDTAAIQAAINAVSNSNLRVCRIPGGRYLYTNVYCYYDAAVNPSFDPDRSGELTIEGDGISPEDATGQTGTILHTTVTSGDGFYIGGASTDTTPYPARDVVIRGISFEGSTTGALALCRGVISPKFHDVQFVQGSAAGHGLWITTAFFGTITQARFKNTGTGTRTGDAIRFGTTLAAGLLTLQDVNAAGYGTGLNCYAGDWQLLSVRDSELAGDAFGVYVSSGARIQQLNFDGCYFEGDATSYIYGGGYSVMSLCMTGCWMYAAGATSAAISLDQPTSVSIDSLTVQDIDGTLLNIGSVPSGNIPAYSARNVTVIKTVPTSGAYTLFTGVVPELIGVNWPSSDPNATLYSTGYHPVETSKAVGGGHTLLAGHMGETSVVNYGAVAGGSIDIAGDGYPAMVWLLNVTSPTTVRLPATSAGLPHGYTVTVTSDFASTVSTTVALNSVDGGATVANLSAGQQRRFVFFDDATYTGWR